MSDSILAEIRNKEIELRSRLLEARRAAEVVVAEAKAQANALLEVGERETEAEVRRLRESELRATQREVDEARRAYCRRAEALASATGLLMSIARRVVCEVAPGAADEGDAP